MKPLQRGLALAAAVLAAGAAWAEPGLAIVVRDQVALRSAPRDSAKPSVLLYQGEALEVRAERMDYLQVWDHRLERGGFVNANQVRRVKLEGAGASDLLAVIRFLRDAPGSESLGIAYAAAYIQAASPDTLRGPEGAEALDALGTFADRLARGASAPAAANKSTQAAQTAHFEIAMNYGVVFATYERNDRMLACYEGEAFRHVLASQSAGDELRARAALALTRLECTPGDLQPVEKRQADETRADLLDKVDVAKLPPYLRNRVLMRRAAVWNSLAFQSARRGEATQAQASRAILELSRVTKDDLTDEDQRVYADAATRVNASRWAAILATQKPQPKGGERPRIATARGQPGETCVMLVDSKHDGANPLARRCTYGMVWEESATLNREGNALAIAVQHTETWREMWIFRKSEGSWSIRALPPAAATPGVGYAEFAGWVPGGKQMLVARESFAEGKYRRTFALMRMDSLTTASEATDPAQLPAFQRWQDPAWKQATLSLR
jgi:hypothetical protein